MGLHQDLISLCRKQKHVDDGVRLFYDGSIRTRTITGAGRIGWYIIAASVPGASPLIGRYFEAGPIEERFLRIKNLRDALMLRDKIITTTTEARVQRLNKSVGEVRCEESGWSTPVSGLKF